jgi:hypothetical protein
LPQGRQLGLGRQVQGPAFAFQVVEKGQVEEAVLVGLVHQVKAGGKQEEVARHVGRRRQRVHLPGREEKHARRADVVKAEVDGVRTRPPVQQQHLEEVVAVRKRGPRRAATVEHLHQAFALGIRRRRKRLQVVNGNFHNSG